MDTEEITIYIEDSQAINITMDQQEVVNVTLEDSQPISITIEDSQESNILDLEQTIPVKGADGASAYQIWLSLGNVGTEADFIEALKQPAHVPWSVLTEVPKTFFPSEHSHPTSEIIGLTETLNTLATNESVDAKIAATPKDAFTITYNEVYPTVAAALDKLLYINPTVSISGGGSYEIGTVLTSATLTWNYNKTMASQSLNQGIGGLDIALRKYTHSNQTVSSNRTYTITGSDGTNSASASTTIAFYYKRYWGAASDETLTNAQILALSSELSSSRSQSRTFNCSGGKYFYFAIPTSFCSSFTMKVGGLAYSDYTVQTISLTNAQGYVSSYNIYRSGSVQNGSAILVEVS